MKILGYKRIERGGGGIQLPPPCPYGDEKSVALRGLILKFVQIYIRKLFYEHLFVNIVKRKNYICICIFFFCVFRPDPELTLNKIFRILL